MGIFIKNKEQIQLFVFPTACTSTVVQLCCVHEHRQTRFDSLKCNLQCSFRSVRRVCLPVRMGKFGPHMAGLTFLYFSNVERTQVSLKADKNNGYFT